MTPRFAQLNAAFHQMLGRCDASRKAGLTHKAHLQFRAAMRLYQYLLK